MQTVNITLPIETINLSLFALSKLAESAQQASEAIRVEATRAVEAQAAASRVEQQQSATLGASSPIPVAEAADSEGGQV